MDLTEQLRSLELSKEEWNALRRQIYKLECQFYKRQCAVRKRDGDVKANSAETVR